MAVVIRPIHAQDGQNWLQAVVNGDVEVVNLTGGTPFAATPSLVGTFENQLATGYSLFPVGGDILNPASADYCSLVLAGSNMPMEIPPAGERAQIELLGYCLELPTERVKPDEQANYLPLNYGGQVVNAVREVLDLARAGELEFDFGTQVAVWQVYNGLSLRELETATGQDFSPYAPQLAYLLDGGELPDVAELVQPTTVTETTTDLGNEGDTTAVEAVEESGNADTAENADDSGVVVPAQEDDSGVGQGNVGEAEAPVDDVIFGIPATLFYVLAGLLGLLLLGSIALLGVALSRGGGNTRRRPPARRGGNNVPRRRPSQKKLVPAEATAPAYSAPVTAEPASTVSPLVAQNGTKCLICGSQEHSTRECPEIHRPNQAFMPTEVELTLANVDEVGAAAQPENVEPDVPELETFWEKNARDLQESTRYLEPPTQLSPGVDSEFFEVAKLRTKIANEEMPIDTSGVAAEEPELIEEPSAETGAVSRKHVTYIIREKGKAEVIGSLGDDGGVISRINMKDQQILLPPKDVSTPHALLRIRPDGRVTIKDLRSKNGTYIYDERVDAGKQVQLYDGSRIRFGDSAEFDLDLSRRKLVAVGGNTITRDLSSADQWLITRRNLHSVVVPNSQLSSPHMLIRPSDDVVSEIRLKDLHSHNPTYIGDMVLGDFEDGTYVESDSADFRVGKTVYTIQARSQKVVDVLGDHFKVIKQVYISKMADVYAVKDMRVDDAPLQAAKVLNIHQDKKDQARIAFEREMELMQKFNNPHLPRLDATGHDQNYDAPFYVMPYLDGSDMRRILHQRRKFEETGALRLPDIRAVVEAVCAALEAMHALNYAHCDVKPANIFLTNDGEIYLIDLGVVTHFGKNAEFFTQFYSAPEVGSKKLPPVSAASDVYSLGIVLLEMLTGLEAKDLSGFATEPAQEVSNTESSKPQVGSMENLEAWLTESPVGLDFIDVIHKATLRQPSERYQSVAAFWDAFEAAVESGARVLAMSELDGDEAAVGELARVAV